MGINTNPRFLWTLAVFIHGGQGHVDTLDESTQFRFARFTSEVEWTPIATLPLGIISLISGLGLEDDTLESGLIIEMSTRGEAKDGWVDFEMLAGHASMRDSRGKGKPRSAYASPNLDGSVEFVDVPCYSLKNGLPNSIKIRAIPLPISLIAWGISNELFTCAPGVQMTLDEWFDLPEMGSPKKSNVLALPGPPNANYDFFNGFTDM